MYVDTSTRRKDTEKDWEIRMLYDGDCPLCMREVNMLRRRDEGVGKIDFVDISSPSYEAEANANISYEEVSPLSVSKFWKSNEPWNYYCCRPLSVEDTQIIEWILGYLRSCI